MIKRIVTVTAACGLLAGLVGLALVAGPTLDDFLDRYPSSVRIADQDFNFQAIGQVVIRQQATYQTPDKVAVVRRWYTARFHISPASELNVTASDGCAWLTQSHLVIRVQHTVAVLLCPVAGGTRVVINESLELEP